MAPPRPPPSFGPRFPARGYAIVYLLALCGYSAELARFGDRHTGFSSLIQFGDHFASRRLPSLSGVPLYTCDDDGYDGQFYAQLAVAGNPFDPALGRALDSPPYRERRLLLPVVAHTVGLGHPALVVQVFALANLACLWVLAALLARWWFPPADLHNLLGWAGTVFAAGMVVSGARSLVDGPALLLLAIAVRQVELGRPRRAAVWLALAALTRETSLFGAAGLFSPAAPGEGGWRRARRSVALALAAATPCLAWMVWLRAHYGYFGGGSNFATPFASLIRKLGEISSAAGPAGRGAPAARAEALILLGLGVQIVFLAARPRPAEPWWRVGASFAGLWAFLGWPVWAGFPSATARAVLPLSLAFNRLVPRSRFGLGLLLSGNLGLLALPALLGATAPAEQRLFVDGVRLRYGPGWHPVEHGGRHVWRWASGAAATLVLDNPNPDARRVTLELGLASTVTRSVIVTPAPSVGPAERTTLAPNRLRRLRLGPWTLLPGETEVVFSTDAPGWLEPVSSGRTLTFSVHDLVTTVGPAPPQPGAG